MIKVNIRQSIAVTALALRSGQLVIGLLEGEFVAFAVIALGVHGPVPADLCVAVLRLLQKSRIDNLLARCRVGLHELALIAREDISSDDIVTRWVRALAMNLAELFVELET